MKRLIRAAAVAAAISVFSLLGTAQQTATTHTIAATTVRELRVWDSFVTSALRTGALRTTSRLSDPAVRSRVIERFAQFHDGVRVWGSDLVRDSDDGGLAQSIFGELVSNLTVATTPTLTALEAEAAMAVLAAPGGVVLERAELVLAPLDSGEYRLSYTTVVAGESTLPVRIFIDAHTGVELIRISEIRTQAHVVSGTGVFGDPKKVSVHKEGNTFFADDRLRPPVLLTYDMRGNLTRARAAIEQGAALSPSDRASDTGEQWTAVAQVDAHVHIGWTYDYYFKRFERRGLDDRDRPIRIVTNAVSQTGALILPTSLLDYALGAFWCGTCGPSGSGVMFFGNGIPSSFTFGGQHITYLAGALDVAAHELTHGVIDSSSNLVYRNESGALNESIADIMGVSVEHFFHPAGSGRGRADYLIGEDVFTGSAASARDGVRSMENPGIYQQPDHYSQRYRGLDDNGGVHINSGVPNNAFYLAIEGGTNRTSGLSVQGVGAANRERVERVFYRAFIYLLPASARFTTARAATIQAARDLYGENSDVERVITQAWTAVGVN